MHDQRVIEIIFRIGFIAFSILVEATFVAWIAIALASFIRDRWRKFREKDTPIDHALEKGQ